MIREHRRHGSPLAHALPLLPQKLQQSAALSGKHLLLPHHIPGEMDALLHLIGVGQGCGQGIAEVPRALNTEVNQQGQRYRCQQGLGIGMETVPEHLLCVSKLYYSTQIHDQDAVGDMLHH